MSESRTILSLFDDPDPGLVFCEPDFPEDVLRSRVKHVARPPLSSVGRSLLDSVLPGGQRFDQWRSFYSLSDGADLCCARPLDGNGDEQPLLTLLPVEEWPIFTSAFMPGGKLAWFVELNQYRRARTLYRDSQRWIAFGRLKGGGALTTFTSGDMAGSIFFLSAEPGWNITHPLFLSFDALSAALGSDIAAVLRRLQVVSPDGLRLHDYIRHFASHRER